MDGRRRGPIVAPDGYLNAALAEPSELSLPPGDALRGARPDRHLEPRPTARPHRVLGDRLGGVRREPARPLESAARLACGGHDAHPEASRPFRSARLRLAARADEEVGSRDEIAVRTHLIEDAFPYHDREPAFERHR